MINHNCYHTSTSRDIKSTQLPLQTKFNDIHIFVLEKFSIVNCNAQTIKHIPCLSFDIQLCIKELFQINILL